MDAVEGARGLLAWWALAGVDEAIDDEPHGWLGRLAVANPAARPTVAPAENIVAPAYPTDLRSFHDWLTSDIHLPEAAWGVPAMRVAPQGQAASRLMVITDLPDAEDISARNLFAGEAGTLFDNILRAMGLDRDGIYLASLAVARPAGGMIPPETMMILAQRMRHHIALVGPKRVLILGDKTSRALPTTSGEAPSSGLRPLNHEGGTVDAVATFHPRFLLKQPAAKAQAWAVLRNLI